MTTKSNHTVNLIPSDKSSSAESSIRSGIPPSAKGTAAVSSTSDKTASPEINLGRRGLVGNHPLLRNLPADVAEQCVDALMVTLDRRTRPVDLKQAGNDC